MKSFWKRKRLDEYGPFTVVGWGPFFLPGEKKRLRKAEKARIQEMRIHNSKFPAVSYAEAARIFDDE